MDLVKVKPGKGTPAHLYKIAAQINENHRKVGEAAAVLAEQAIESLDHSTAIKQLIATGKEEGILTIDEINDALPSGEITTEQMDEIFSVFTEMNIEVIDGASTVTISKAANPPEDEKTEELDLDPSLDTRTDDPVRMYLREMGSPVGRIGKLRFVQILAWIFEHGE